MPGGVSPRATENGFFLIHLGVTKQPAAAFFLFQVQKLFSTMVRRYDDHEGCPFT